MSYNLPGWTFPAMLFGLLILAGIGDYLGKLPGGTFASFFFLVAGLVAPSPAFPHTQVVTPTATVNTNKTTIEADKAVTPPQ